MSSKRANEKEKTMEVMTKAEKFCQGMLDEMHRMGVWPTEFKGIVRSEAQDREAVGEILQEKNRYVAFSGDIKAGKSTLLNQLLFPDVEKSVLPTDPTPETAKITLISSVPEGSPERFEVSFYSPNDWRDVKVSYQSSKYNEKFKNNIAYSESVGATESTWVGHDPVTSTDFSQLAEYVSCHDPAKANAPGVVRGKYVPYVKNVHVYCHSKWLSADTTIVDTPGLADPNPINQDATKRWIGKAVFVFYVHSVEYSADMSRGQKDFLRDYIQGIDVNKFAIVANFFDARMDECAEGDEYTDVEVMEESDKLVGILHRKNVPWCLPDHIFPFSAKFYRKDARLDPKGFADKVCGILRQKVSMGEFFGRATKIIFQSLSGHRNKLNGKKAELQTRVEVMRKTLEQNQIELKKLRDDKKQWEHEVNKLKNDRIEQIRGQILSVNTEIKKIKGTIEDTVELKLNEFKRSGELAAGLKRVVSRILNDHFAPFHQRAFKNIVDYRNVAVGDEFSKKLVSLYNAYLGKGGKPFLTCAIEQCKIDFRELEADVWNGNFDDEWNKLADKVDSLFAFYRTNLENAKSGVMEILSKHVYGVDDRTLKAHYIKPYEDMREYVLTRIKEIEEAFGKMETILEEEIDAKKRKTTAEYDENRLTNEISEIETAIRVVDEFFEKNVKERDIIRASLS